MVKRKLKYYSMGMISLVGLPFLFLLFYGSQINNVYKKRSIEIIVAEGYCGKTPFPFDMFAKSQNVEYSFAPRNEKSQIDSFKLFYRILENKYPDKRILVKLNIDKYCSYQLLINIIDVIGQGSCLSLIYNGSLYLAKE
jgi:DNA-directed RNA polymerase subunit N (RpoN/RPB10)